MELDKVLKERHSVRKFSTKEVSWRDILEAVDAARLAPLAGNKQCMRFIVVNEKEKIEKIATACQQNFIALARYVVILCTDQSQVVRSYGERGEMYCRQQAGAAIENFLLKITELGLATCWVGAFSDSTIRHILRIPESIFIEAVLPIGYEMPPKSEQRHKPPLQDMLWFNTWRIKRMGHMKTPEPL